MTFERYAIYFTPKNSTRLARFGTDWLGRNTRGEDTAGFPAMDEAQKALVATPRRYGFHATLKAPFALRKGETLKGLKQAMARFAAQQQRVKAGPLHLTDMGRFLALTPDERTCRRLTLLWGVRPVLLDRFGTTDGMIQRAEQRLLEMGLAGPGDTVVYVAGGSTNTPGGTDMLKIHRFE